ncbi:MAG: HEAT repeat domain-containing protein [Pirellulaceae bacterium]
MNRPVSADILHLKSGGKIEGELLNPDQEPREFYEIKTEQGQLTLAASVVQEFVAQSEAQKRYKTFLPRMPDTIDGKWQMAQWCKENGLDDKWEYHLEEILALEPDHVEARRALGYVQHRGKWIIREQWMRQQGFVYHRGSWRLAQEVAMLEAQDEASSQVVEWRKQLRMWRLWIRRGGDRAQEAVKSISGIEDPTATEPLLELLDSESDVRIRVAVIVALTKIPSPQVTMALAELAFEDQSVKIRDQAAIALERRDHDVAVGFLIRKLKSDDNGEINRAAAVLTRLKHPAAIGPLIDALATTHKFVEQPGGGPGRMNAAFGSGAPGGFGFGAPQAKTVIQELNNEQVLAALMATVGGEVNFRFDKERWRLWHSNDKIPLDTNLRRD